MTENERKETLQNVFATLEQIKNSVITAEQYHDLAAKNEYEYIFEEILPTSAFLHLELLKLYRNFD